MDSAMSADCRSDPDLLNPARSGDEGALAVLVERHRDRMCDAGQEVSLHRGALPQVTSLSMAEHPLGNVSTPSHAAMRAMRKVRAQQALNSMDPNDREVLILRHFEDLGNAEAAQILGIKPTAAVNRYVRALKRLRDVFQAMPGGTEGL
jgi:RNA polymerase sigma-70 factor (ECF subfamily)